MVGEPGEGHDRPDGGVGVLTAVLPHARKVSLDVTGVQGGLVEGRVEQLDQSVVGPDTSRRSTASIAVRDRSGSPAAERTDQLCGIESIWHSGLAAAPSGVPSSK